MTRLEKPICEPDDIQHVVRRLRLLAAVLGLQHYTSTESNIVPIPGGDRVIAIGKPVVARVEIEDCAARRSAAGQPAERWCPKVATGKLTSQM